LNYHTPRDRPSDTGRRVAEQTGGIPRFSILGGIFLVGYLGGAVATHVRVGSPVLSHVLFPVYVALLLWGGLFLRDSRLRALMSRPI
jgi:hypothetical protein